MFHSILQVAQITFQSLCDDTVNGNATTTSPYSFREKPVIMIQVAQSRLVFTTEIITFEQQKSLEKFSKGSRDGRDK